MRLRIGARVPHDVAELSPSDPPEVQRNRAVYRITEVIAESPWGGLYRGRKVFRNFDFGKRCLVEVEDDECLDVLLKTLAYPLVDQKEYVSARRDHAWFEAKKVLGCRKTNLIPEPLDFLEVRNDQDGFNFPHGGRCAVREPVMVCEFIYGENLARWRQRNSSNIAGGLRMLAELLELINVLHGQHVLLNNVSPAAFWADEMDRVHFVGTENVIDETKAAAWKMLFPPERYARGFAAPELFEPNAAPSRESDLFGWASLSYFLITGESPSGLAVQQQRKSPCFAAAQREKLKGALAALDRVRVIEFKALFEVGGSRFEKTWPDSFVDGVLACLNEERNRRPPDIPSLRHWWEAAPPTPVPHALGVSKKGRTSLVFSTNGLASSLRFAIRRQIGEIPRSINAGTEIWSGKPAGVVEDVVARSGAVAELHYGVFSIDDRDGTTSISSVTPIPVLDGNNSAYVLSLVEDVARTADSEAAFNGTELPPTVELLAQLDAPASFAMQLLGSQLEVVRAWSIEFLKRRLLRLAYDQDCRALLLERGLRDSSAQVRLKSARAAVQTAITCNLSFVVDLANRLGGDVLEDRIRASRDLPSIGVPSALAQQAIDALEADRPVPCPECTRSIRARELDAHLTAIHGYVPVDGKALPLKEGLKKLWSKLFKDFEPRAFAALGSEFARRHGDQAGTALIESFRQQFTRFNERHLSEVPAATLSDYLDRIAQCFHSHEIGKSLCRQLLTDSEPRIREIGRRFFVPGVAHMYSGDDADLTRFLKSIAFLVPSAATGERIRLCRLLENRGASPIVARQAEQELELERLQPCPECGESITRRRLGRHRRMQHGVFELAGTGYSWETLVDTLVDRMLTGDSSLFAAQTLADVYQERFGAKAADELAGVMIANLNLPSRAAPTSERVQNVARSLAPTAIGSAVCRCALAAANPIGHVFGLNLFAHLSRCEEIDLLRSVAEMNGRAEIPLDSRKSATENLLRVGAGQRALCQESLTRLVQSTSGDALTKIDLLQSLKHRVGESDLVDEVCRNLEEGRRIRCTKCGEIFNGKEMEEHALTSHGLVFDGRVLRQPWGVAMECLDTFLATSNPAILERGESLSKIRGQSGRDHLNFIREALKRGIDPGFYRRTLETAAANAKESICPSCFGPLGDPRGAVTEVTLSGRGELISSYMQVRRTGDERFVFQYELDLGKKRWLGQQPPMRPTRLGAVLAVLALFWIPALVFVIVGFMPTPGAMAFANGSFLIGVAGAITILLGYHPRFTSALDFTWSFVVPELLKEGIDCNSAAFLRGLSAVSSGQGRIPARRRPLAHLVDELKKDIAAGDLEPACLCEPLQLFRDDLQATKANSTEILRFFTSLIDDLIAGRLSLAVFEAVTHAGSQLVTLSVGTRVALRWHLYQSSIKQSWAVADLIELANSSNAVRALLSADPAATTNVIAEAWALMSESEQRNALPTGARSPFEIINSGDLIRFRQTADLLVMSRDERLRIDSAGLSIDGEYYFSPPRLSTDPVTEFVQTGWTYQRVDGGPDLRYRSNPPVGYNRVVAYNLTINEKTERCNKDPAAFVRLIETYSTFLFQRIRPRAAECAHSPRTGKAECLVAEAAIRCPRCHESLHFRAGTFAESR